MALEIPSLALAFIEQVGVLFTGNGGPYGASEPVFRGCGVAEEASILRGTLAPGQS